MSNGAIFIIIVLAICALVWRSERNAAQKKLDDIEMEKRLKDAKIGPNGKYMVKRGDGTYITFTDLMKEIEEEENDEKK